MILALTLTITSADGLNFSSLTESVNDIVIVNVNDSINLPRERLGRLLTFPLTLSLILAASDEPLTDNVFNNAIVNMPETMRAASFLDKGGVGKTTATAHLGVALDNLGLDVLLIDLAGKQNDLAKHFGIFDAVEPTDDWPNISTVFDDNWSDIAEKLPSAAEEMILTTDEGPDLIPAHKGLDQVDGELASVAVEDRFSRFSSFLDNHIDPLDYDAVLIDLPGLTNNVTLNGLWATGNVIAPAELGAFEEKQMDALEDDLEELEEEFGAVIDLSMVIPNKVDTRTNLGTELLEKIRDRYPNVISPAYIPQSQDIKNAQNQGQTIFELEEPSSTAARARDAYQENATELVDRIEGDD